MRPVRGVLGLGVALLAAVLLAFGTGIGAVAAERVDLRLVLAIDVSRSISDDKFELERQGYAEALTDPKVLAAIRNGAEGRIAIAIVEWAGSGEQAVVADWALITDEASAAAVAKRLITTPRAFYGRTAIGSALDVARQLIGTSPYPGERSVIDVSGDGTSNQGRDIAAARDAAVAEGITINGIVILTDPVGLPPYLVFHTNPPGGLAAYYRDTVIGGPGAFVMTAESFETFGRSLVAKLIREIS